MDNYTKLREYVNSYIKKYKTPNAKENLEFFKKLNILREKLPESKIEYQKLKDKLIHIIVSHHGKSEFGSPKEPMIPEALVVYCADEMSSKVSEMLEFIETSKDSTEDDFMYSKRTGRNIFLR